MPDTEDTAADIVPAEPEGVVTTPEAPTAPTKVPEPPAADGALVEAVGGGLSWIPFAVYLALWVALSGATAYLLQGATPEQPARWMPAYPLLVACGIALAALGPALSLAVWLIARTRHAAPDRRGLFAAAAIRGALMAFFGTLLWLVTLYVLESFANGRHLW